MVKFEYIFKIVAEIKFPESNLSGSNLDFNTVFYGLVFRRNERDVLNLTFFVFLKILSLFNYFVVN